MAIAFNQHQMGRLTDRCFEQRLIQLLCRSDPAAGRAFQAPDGLAELRRQCAKARRCGMQAELDIARYVITAWLLGPDFDERFPAMAEILGSDRISASQKAEAIERVSVAVLTELAEGAA